MLFLLGETLQQVYGPFRLLTSHVVVASVALMLSSLATWLLLPRIIGILPRDRGREFAVDKEAALGKPTGAGLAFGAVFAVVGILTAPLELPYIGVVMCVTLAMLAGFLDDSSAGGWHEYRKGLIDLGIALAAALLVCDTEPAEIWLPFTTAEVTVPPVVCIVGGTLLIWGAINATNCTDGVDGLSGMLAIQALLSLGGLLYFILGHDQISAYLRLPHYVDGAEWAMLSFAMVGCLTGYLWYNAHPSQLLMGDAGSRAVGLLLGVLVINSGNPFLIFIVSGVLLVNGGTGLIKVALLRFLRVAIFAKLRFPLHDHVRNNLGWSSSQVVVRFALVQIMFTLVSLVILIKVR